MTIEQLEAQIELLKRQIQHLELENQAHAYHVCSPSARQHTTYYTYHLDPPFAYAETRMVTE